MLKRNKNGTFARKNNFWIPENWDDGYMDNKGRFRVYRPDYPRAYHEGYALRAHVVWWLENGKPHAKDTEIHHIDGTRDNDHIENLVCLSHGEHRSIHQENFVTIKCIGCGKEFKEHFWRVSERGRKFCSQECYHKTPRTKEHKQNISKGLKWAYKLKSR